MRYYARRSAPRSHCPMSCCHETGPAGRLLLAVAWPMTSAPTGRRSARSPSTRPTKGRCFVGHLPRDEFQFVELVERGRPDWLASACRQGVRCDVLLISGHFDDGDEFYSDRLDAREFLPVDEMERVACSETCPGLFSRLKEVYLFGCNTLNARRAQERLGRDRAQSRPLRALPGRRRAPGARAERPARRKQPRSHAQRLQGRAGDLRLFRRRRRSGRRRPPCWTAIFNPAPAARSAAVARARGCCGLFAPSSMTVASGHERCGSAGGLSPGRVPFLRRSPVAGAEARLRPSSSSGATWRKCACFSTTSTIYSPRSANGSGNRRRLRGRSTRSRAIRRHAPGIWNLRATPTSPRCAPA